METFDVLVLPKDEWRHQTMVVGFHVGDVNGVDLLVMHLAGTTGQSSEESHGLDSFLQVLISEKLALLVE